MVTIGYSGAYMGNAVSMIACGALAANVGWESTFYVFGAIGCIWFVAYILIVKRSPETDSHCTELETKYISNSISSSSSGPLHYPWIKLLTSIPVWAVVSAHFAELWGTYTMTTQLPMFLNDVLHFNVQKSGFLSALPYLALFFCSSVSGYLTDWLQVKGYLRTIQVRKFFTCGGFLGQTVFLLLAVYILDPTWSIVCLTLGVAVGGVVLSGYSATYLDLSPRYAGTMYGIGVTVASLGGIVSPLLTGYVVQTKAASEWQIIFYITAGFYIAGAAVYGMFATTERLPWAEEESTK